MVEFSSLTARKARKQHKCEFCKKQISIGEIYSRVFVVDDGAHSYALHDFCDTISQIEIRESDDDYCTLDFLFDCAYQKVIDEKNTESTAEFYGVTKEQIDFVFGVVA